MNETSKVIKAKFGRQFILDLEHKMGVLEDTDDLREGYELTTEQVEAFSDHVRRASVLKLTELEIPHYMLEAVHGEMENQAQIYLDNESFDGNSVHLLAATIRKQLSKLPQP